jgi:hypothetical protein
LKIEGPDHHEDFSHEFRESSLTVWCGAIPSQMLPDRATLNRFQLSLFNPQLHEFG